MDVIIDTRLLKFVIRDDRHVLVKFTETILDSRLSLSMKLINLYLTADPNLSPRHLEWWFL